MRVKEYAARYGVYRELVDSWRKKGMPSRMSKGLVYINVEKADEWMKVNKPEYQLVNPPLDKQQRKQVRKRILELGILIVDGREDLRDEVKRLEKMLKSK